MLEMLRHMRFGSAKSYRISTGTGLWRQLTAAPTNRAAGGLR